MHSFHGFFVDTARKKIYNSGANGPVAQLGECYIRIVEVVGSTPIRSTIFRTGVFTPVHSFCNGFLREEKQKFL